jgi:ribosome maturation factor RimP
MGFDLYKLKFIKAGTHSILRIFIDKEEGITIKDCEEASHEISILLDVENFYNKKYTLEVSSPGIDRLLTTEKDFKRVIGKNIKLRLKEPDKKNSAVKGKLLECVDGSLTIDIQKEIKKVPVSNIVSGKTEITFK